MALMYFGLNEGASIPERNRETRCRWARQGGPRARPVASTPGVVHSAGTHRPARRPVARKRAAAAWATRRSSTRWWPNTCARRRAAVTQRNPFAVTGELTGLSAHKSFIRN